MDNIVKRTFIPGDQWIYFKLYTGYKTADTILSKTLPPIIAQLNAKNMIDKWFFIRYSDPHSHLRLRFYANDVKNVSLIISSINQAITPYVSNDLIWKMQLDTYQREMERYGTKTIEHTETIFHFDSEAIMNTLSILEGNENNQQRWLLALKMLDALFDDFEFNIDQKIELITKLSEDFKKEFRFTIKEGKLQLDKKFRANRKLIEEIMIDTSAKEWSIFLNIIKEKSISVMPVAKALLNMEIKQELEVPLNSLLRSYTHMMINRLFRTKQRLYEMTLYDMLERYYTSLKARNKYNTKIVHLASHESLTKAVTI